MVKHPCPCTETCALQQVVAWIGGKWKLPILCSLAANGPSRYHELLHATQGISNTMLSQSLKELERDRLIVRREYTEIPIRVEYELSEKARRLQPILSSLRLSENPKIDVRSGIYGDQIALSQRGGCP